MSTDYATHAPDHENTQVFSIDAGTEQPAEPFGIKVFAGNLTFSTTDEGLRAFFAPVADEIITATVVQRFGRSAGYGFVTVKTQEAAEKAVAALNKQEVDGRAVIVEVARTNEAKDAAKKERQAKRKEGGRRGSKAVPGEVTEAEANGTAVARIDDDANATQGATGGAAGEAKPKKKKSSKKRKAKNPAANGDAGAETTVLAITNGDVPAAAEGEVREKPARKPRPPRAPRPHREPGETPLGDPSKSVLFIANLSFSVDEAALAEFFTNAGVNVKTARVVRRRWGTPRKSKGYGFVDVGDEVEQQRAIELTNGKTLAEREISVKIAVDADHARDGGEKAAEGHENPAQDTVE
ncbi:hypothetical protein FRB94_014111 [Tulasnella sp. JGI-2019a]|nr:hypothetical protein FRB93_013129 [Tulasnella sp. JGI-2019a]KAG9007689.1 hypothetical protein FRB94_014111 [Tulasnella sp. JGI-2019a]KAG9027073.1 hypothetical protein FRB95_008149 [Tulasnella sp. JGI-2019a]